MKKQENKIVNYGLLIIVGLLLVVSVVQAGQIQVVKNELGDAPTEYKTSNDVPVKSAAIPTAPAKLPAMVGGC